MTMSTRRMIGIVSLGMACALGLAGCPTSILPNADFTVGVVSGEVPLPVVFGDASKPGMEPLTSWHWDFGDGQTADTQYVNHVYQNVGHYTVSLTVSDSMSSDTETKVGYINAFRAPVPNFSASVTEGKAPLAVTFTSTSVVGSSPVLSLFWDFGDGASSGEFTPTHTYDEPGVYDVYMYVFDENGARPHRKKDYIHVAE